MWVTSINPYFTFNYSQPEDYHFSHDSVFLARRVFELVAGRLSPQSLVLDLCSGCGIVGLDFGFHCQKELDFAPSCDFVEVQETYQPHFIENVRRLAPDNPQSLRFLSENYAALQSPQYANRYDVVLCNPPYFRIGQGKTSPSEFKNRCRFFIDSDFPTLLRTLVHTLRETGEAYILLRDLSDHSTDPLAEARRELAQTAQINVLRDIRGTALVRIKK